MDTNNPETASRGSAGDTTCEESGAAHEGNATLRRRYQAVEQQLSDTTTDRRTRQKLERELEQLGQTFIEANEGLVYRFTSRFSAARPEQRDEYVAAAFMGLWRAWTTWDVEAGPLGGWAWQHMKAAVHPTVRQDDHPGLNERDFNAKPKVMAAIHELTLELGDPPSEQQIADHAGLPEQRVSTVLQQSGRPASLDAPINNGSDDGGTLAERLAAPVASDEDETSEGGALDLLASRLSSLDPTALWAILRRHGLDGAEPQYLREIATDLHLGREVVRRHLNHATDEITGEH